MEVCYIAKNLQSRKGHILQGKKEGGNVKVLNTIDQVKSNLDGGFVTFYNNGVFTPEEKSLVEGEKRKRVSKLQLQNVR